MSPTLLVEHFLVLDTSWIDCLLLFHIYTLYFCTAGEDSVPTKPWPRKDRQTGTGLCRGTRCQATAIFLDFRASPPTWHVHLPATDAFFRNS